jgi:hypothetical protein
VRDTGGAVLASASTTFIVQSSSATGSGLTGTLSGTPNPVPYGDPIAFSAALRNLGNADLFALGAKIAVVDPSVPQVLAEFPAAVDVPRQGTTPLAASWAAFAPVGGTYVAVLSATVGTATLTLAQYPFTIAPPVVRVTGTLTAVPKEVPQGDPVALNLTVTNVGFGAISGLPLTVTVADSATQQVAAQFTDSAGIALAGTYQNVFSWPVTGAVGTIYTVTLGATINGVVQVLAQDSFKVLPPPVKLDVTLDRLKQGRVLVLLSCKPDHDHDQTNDHAQNDAAGHTHGTSTGRDHEHHGAHHDSVDYDDRHYKDSDDLGWDLNHHYGPDHDGASASDCVLQRQAFLDGWLTGLGVTHLITTTEADFRKAFRSGAYNTYWIAGGADRLKHNLDEELREAVNRGDALVMDAVHDERNHALDAILGVNVQGKLNPTGQAVNVTGPIFAAGSITTAGRPLRVILTTGQAQAAFPAVSGYPAIVSNAYGQGHGMLFAFDFVGTLMAQPGSAVLRDIGLAAFGWLAPEVPATATAGDYTVIRTRVQNLARDVDLRVTLTLPAGTTLVGTDPAATPDAGGGLVWTLTLGAGQAVDLNASIRLPAAAGSYTAQVKIESIRNTQVTLYNSYSLTVAVSDAAQTNGAVVAGLQGLALSSADQNHRDHVLQHLSSAESKTALGRDEDAIDEFLEALEDLSKITSADVSAYRLQIDRMLDEAEYRWWLALP